MKYAGSYRQREYYDYFDEIHFSKLSQALDYYEDQQGTKDGCLEVLEMKTQKFNDEPVTPELFHKIIEKYPQLRLEFYDLTDLIHYREHGYRSDRISFHYPADSYNLIITLMKYNVSDVLLDEPFVFEIERIHNFIKFYNEDCRIHIRPYIGKPSWMDVSESIMHHFWVLPQHIYVYEEYVDFIDIFAQTETRERRLIEAYCIKKEYTNLLGPFVQNSALGDQEMSAAFVTPELAEARTKCKQICMTRVPSICHRCDACLRIMRQIAEDFKNVRNGEQSRLLEYIENK